MNWCLERDFKFKVVDFTSNWLKKDSIVSSRVFAAKYILVISNFDFVKNLFLISRIVIKRKLLGKKVLSYCILSSSRPAGFNLLVYLLLTKLKVCIITDQNLKNDLIVNCDYLFIPSYTEYLPIVALEAMAFNKKVLSYYHIAGLKKYTNYYYLKD
jgi:glycosyltransferase involved in cell wall biosynthesis